MRGKAVSFFSLPAGRCFAALRSMTAWLLLLPFALLPLLPVRACAEGERCCMVYVRVSAKDAAGPVSVGSSSHQAAGLALSAGSVCRTETGESHDLAGLTGSGRILRILWRFRASGIAAKNNLFTLRAGEGEARTEAASGRVVEGWNLWDVTEALSGFLARDSAWPAMELVPANRAAKRGIQADLSDSIFCLWLSLPEGADGPEAERITDYPLLDAALSALPENHLILKQYQSVADSLTQAKWSCGAPYYYGGHSEEKVLRRLFPLQESKYYKSDRLYLCGFDCGSFLHWAEETAGFLPHEGLQTLLFRRKDSCPLVQEAPDLWWQWLLPGDMLTVNHGSFHILMYLGTPRMFGLTPEEYPELADCQDAPLVIHCGEDPFCYDRFQAYIDAHRGEWRQIPWPPDGGVTVSLVVSDPSEAPHLRTAPWKKDYGYFLAGDQPLTAFPLDDCAQIVWSSPVRARD